MRRCIVLGIVLGYLLYPFPDYGRVGKSCTEISNVVLIVVDTLAAQHLGFMGYERDTSPFIDQLASRSVVFNRAYTPRSTTVPAFTSLLSGCHPNTHGVIENGHNLPENVHFLSEDFRQAGFATWAVPSARVIGAQFGMGRGFDYYANTPAIPHPAPRIIERVQRILTGSPWFGEPNYIETDKPLFLLIHFYDPHTEYTPDEDIRAMFSDPAYDGIIDGTAKQLLEYNDYRLDLTESDLREVRDLYDAEIRTFDRNLESLFDLLTETGFFENSAIVFTADHGENLGEHHFITHGQPYEKGLHIPLFFHFPGDRMGGTEIDATAELTDVIPTLMDLMKVPLPPGIDGRSLLPLINADCDGEYREREYLYAIGHPTQSGRTHSVFDGTYRLIVEFGSNGTVNEQSILLFDILHDPSESENLASTRYDVLEKLAPILGHMVAESPEMRSGMIDPHTREMLASLGYI